jgi:Flp pilus assembly protein TadG
MTSMRAPSPSSFKRLCRRFVGDDRGGAAAEFAIVTPVILALAFGASELGNGVAAGRKASLTARAISDIVAQGKSTSDAEIANVLSVGKVLMYPYPDTNLKLRVSAINIDSNGQASVVWSDALPASEKRGNGAVTIPAALRVPGTQLIWGEVSYDYKPNLGAFTLLPTWSFKYDKNNMFARPRESSVVCRTGCS